jgi:hypothetical protein
VNTIGESSEDETAGPDSAGTLARASAHEERCEAIEHAYAAARRAIALARRYRREPLSTGRRERECLARVEQLRSAIHELRAADRIPDGTATPGLHKAAGPGTSSLPEPSAASGRRTA